MLDVIDPRTPSGLLRALGSTGLTADKRLGQNFLIDPRVFEQMVQWIGGDHDVIEIGPGPGGLTIGLLEHGARVTAIEIDRRMEPLLASLQQAFDGRLGVVWADAVQSSWGDLQDVQRLSRPVRIVGNLPYYVTSPLLAKLWEDTVEWDRAAVMVQKEVAERIAAPPGVRTTSALSVMLRYCARVQGVQVVPKEAFLPSPEVASAVVQLQWVAPPPVSLTRLRWAVQAGFRHRRKMLRQALSREPGSPWNSDMWSHKMLEKGIDPTKRAEALAWDEWVQLAQLVPEVNPKRGE